jgi:hypothetical protein
MEKNRDLFDAAVEVKHEEEVPENNDLIEFKADVFETGKIHTNLEEIKPRVKQLLNNYRGIQFTDDQIADAKEMHSKLNAFRKSMNDWRIGKEREYNAPFLQVKNDIKEMTSAVDEVNGEIDTQIKAKEERDKEEKKTAIEAFWTEIHPKKVSIPLSAVWNERFLNKTCSESKWKEELQARSAHIDADIGQITNMENEAEVTYMLADYQTTLDIGTSLANFDAYMQRLRACEEVTTQAEETRTDPQNEPEQAHEQMYAITFEITGNKLQMTELNDAMNSIGIKFNVLNRKKVN